MGIYKSNTTKEQDAKWAKRETVDQFLARGGQVNKVEEGISGKKKRKAKSKGIDPQALLDAAMGTDKEAEVVAFLKSQGFEVE